MLRKLCLVTSFVIGSLIASRCDAFDDVWVLGPADNDFNCQVTLSYTATQNPVGWTYTWSAQIYGGTGSTDILRQSVRLRGDDQQFQVDYQYEDVDQFTLGLIQHSTPLVDLDAKVRAKYGLAANTPVVCIGQSCYVNVGSDNAEPVLIMYDNLGNTDSLSQVSMDVICGTSGAIAIQTGDHLDTIKCTNNAATNIVISGNEGSDEFDLTAVGANGNAFIWPGDSGDVVYGSSTGSETIYHPLCPNWASNNANYGSNIDSEINWSYANMWLTWPTPDTVQ